MATVDFTNWVEPDLLLPLGGHTYTVRPPSVEEARAILALAVKSEIGMGLAPGPVPDDLQKVLEGLGDTPLADVTLRPEVHQELKTNGVSPTTISRMAWYAMHYWARGKARADVLAQLMWTPKATEEQEAGEDEPGEAESR